MKKWTSKLLIVFYCAIFLYSGMSLVKYVYTYYESSKSLQEVQTIYEKPLVTIPKEVGGEKMPTTERKVNDLIRAQFHDLLAVNDRIVGWIAIDDTKLNNPILHADDNDFYLHHDYKNRESRAGSVFMDYRNDTLDISRNTILYGHAMKDGTMFGSLKNYLHQDYANTHRTIYLDTLYESYDIEVFAAYETTTDFYYIETEFKTNDNFIQFIKEVQQRSVIDMNVDVGADDNIITLSTCKDAVISDDHRIVVQGKLIKRQ